MSKSSGKLSTEISSRAAITAFGITVAAMFGLSFVPEWRGWGFAHWVLFPAWVRLALVGAAALTAAAALRFGRDTNGGSGAGRSYLLWAIVTGGLFLVLLVALRQQTHFLGDGYTILKWLEEGGAINKVRNFGAQVTLHTLAEVLPTDALGVFRITAWTAGLGATVGALLTAAKLYDDTVRRILFALGILTGGYALVFFGYVENYALFVMFVVLYCLTGVLAVLGRIGVAWCFAALAGVIVVHVFGVVLVPSAVYVIMRGTRAGRMVGDFLARSGWWVIALAAGLAVLAFVWFYNRSLFFQFSFVPPVENRFTVEGYTMFSGAHLLDMVNLLFAVVPGLLLLAVAVRSQGAAKLIRQPVYRFLGLAALGTLGAAFIFDPKLGMPRDWDLFAFAGIPLTVAMMLAMLSDTRRGIGVAVMAVGLGLLALVPRAVVQHTPAMGIAQFDIFRNLDRVKNRNGSYYLVEYTRRQGDSAKADQMAIEWNANLKDQQYLNQGNQLMAARNYRGAIGMFEAAVRENPGYWVAYSNMSEAYLNLGRQDSALLMLRIADGLNPKSPIILSNLGQMYYLVGGTEKAVELWQESIRLDPTFAQPRRFLANHYHSIRDRENYVRALEEMAVLDDAPADALAALADYRAQQNQMAEAAELFRRAIARGLDSVQAAHAVERYPALKGALRQERGSSR